MEEEEEEEEGGVRGFEGGGGLFITSSNELGRKLVTQEEAVVGAPRTAKDVKHRIRPHLYYCHQQFT